MSSALDLLVLPLLAASLLVFASVVPGPLKMVGQALALVASLLLVLEPERPIPHDA